MSFIVYFESQTGFLIIFSPHVFLIILFTPSLMMRYKTYLPPSSGYAPLFKTTLQSLLPWGDFLDDLMFSYEPPIPNSFPENILHPPWPLCKWSRPVIVYLSMSQWSMTSSRVGMRPPLLFYLSGVSSCLADSRCFLPFQLHHKPPET